MENKDETSMFFPEIPEIMKKFKINEVQYVDWVRFIDEDLIILGLDLHFEKFSKKNTLKKTATWFWCGFVDTMIYTLYLARNTTNPRECSWV